MHGYKMARVSAFKNKETKDKIRKIFTENTESVEYYKIVYGYSMQKKLLSRKVSGYIIGYDKDENKIIAIHIRFNGELIEKPFNFTVENVSNIVVKGKDKVQIFSSLLLKPITITVASSIGTTMESALLYPVNQEEGAQDFIEFAKVFLKRRK